MCCRRVARGALAAPLRVERGLYYMVAGGSLANSVAISEVGGIGFDGGGVLHCPERNGCGWHLQLPNLQQLPDTWPLDSPAADWYLWVQAVWSEAVYLN